MTVITWAPVRAPDRAIVASDDDVAPIGGVTGLVPNTTVMPCGTSGLVRYTAEKNTPSDWTVMVEVADPPGTMDRYEGEGVMAKSAVPAAIVTVRFALWVSEPLVPVICKLKVPVEAVGPADVIKLDDTPLPGGGVTGVGSVKTTLPG